MSTFISLLFATHRRTVCNLPPLIRKSQFDLINIRHNFFLRRSLHWLTFLTISLKKGYLCCVCYLSWGHTVLDKAMISGPPVDPLQNCMYCYYFQEFIIIIFSCPFDRDSLTQQFTSKMMKKVQDYSTILKAFLKRNLEKVERGTTSLFLSSRLKLVAGQLHYHLFR